MPVKTQELRITDILELHEDVVKAYSVRDLDMFRIFSVLELDCGTVYIETSVVDDEDIETVEVLFSTDRKYFVLISRSRYGEAHHPMRSYPRDAEFPIHTRFKL